MLRLSSSLNTLRESSLSSLVAAGIACAIALVALEVSFNLYYFHYLCETQSDYRLILLSVEAAKKGLAWAGAYSRLELRHPGPILFYLYATGDWIFQFIPNQLGRISFTQLIINLSCLVYAALALKKYLKSTLPALMVIPLALVTFQGAHGSALPLLSDVWNPFVTACPLIALLISSAFVARGEARKLIPQTLFATLCVHAHLSLIPVAGCICLISWIVGIFSYHRSEHGAALHYAAYATLVALLLNSPLIVEAIMSPRGGNLGAIIRFVLSSDESKSFSEVFSAIARHYIKPVRPIVPDSPTAIFLVVIAGLLYALKDTRTRVLSALTLIGIFASFISLQRTKGELFLYLIHYQFGLVILAYLIIAAAFFHLVSDACTQKISRLGPALSIVLIATLYASAALHLRVLPFSRFCIALRESGDVFTALKPSPEKRYHLIVESPHIWQSAATFALYMSQRNFDVCADTEWAYVFGPALTCDIKQKLAPIGRESIIPVRFSVFDPKNQTLDEFRPEEHRLRRKMLIVDWNHKQ